MVQLDRQRDIERAKKGIELVRHQHLLARRAKTWIPAAGLQTRVMRHPEETLPRGSVPEVSWSVDTGLLYPRRSLRRTSNFFSGQNEPAVPAERRVEHRVPVP